MQLASVAFPFRSTFRRLELEKRWWHRLCVVLFLAGLLCTAIFTAGVAYTAFAPQVTTMPDIETGFSDQQHISGEADVNAILTEADRAALPSNIPLPPQGAHVQGTLTLKQLGQRIKAKYPVYNNVDDEALARSVLAKYPQHSGVVKDAPSESYTLVAADGKPIKGLPSGAVLRPIVPDLTSFQPLVKLVQMPDGSTSRFETTVSDDSIKRQWNHAKAHQTLKAVARAALIAIGVMLLLGYLLQVVYRAFLYVIFGANAQTA